MPGAAGGSSVSVAAMSVNRIRLTLNPRSRTSSRRHRGRRVLGSTQLADDPNAIAPAFEFRGKTYFFGTFGDDIICGTSERDIILSFAGDDCIESGDGNDRVFAGFGDDIVNLGQGDDRALAGPGNDDVEGGPGEDRAHGGFGEDFCDPGTS